MSHYSFEADVRVALDDSGQREVFEKLSSSHQHEYQQWINEAKKPETRAKRIQKMTEMLAESKHPE